MKFQIEDVKIPKWKNSTPDEIREDIESAVKNMEAIPLKTLTYSIRWNVDLKRMEEMKECSYHKALPGIPNCRCVMVPIEEERRFLISDEDDERFEVDPKKPIVIQTSDDICSMCDRNIEEGEKSLNLDMGYEYYEILCLDCIERINHMIEEQ